MEKNDPNNGKIRGSCLFFVCRCCRTKYGWAHQKWCDIGAVTEPGCKDCRYYSARADACRHPVHKQRKGEKPYEEAEYPL